MKLHIDFETRSTVDLKKSGLDNYARHPDTAPWCMGWAFDDEAAAIWSNPPLGLGGLGRVLKFVRHGGIVIAHNAAFELAIWNNICAPRYGWPVLKPEQVRCTMAMAYAMALPGSLENAAAAVGIPMQKDMGGHRLMLQMAKPREIDPLGLPIWWDEPDKLQQLYGYCRQDVRVERELEKRLMPLSADEQALWVLDQKINGRGVGVDLPAVHAALKIVESEKTRLDEEMRDVTKGMVSRCSEVKRLGDWLRLQDVAMPGLAKADVLDALSLDALPPLARRALLLRQEAGKTSTAKLKAMAEAASEHDGRVRGTLQYHGAGTGRWAGRRLQPHNMPRPKLKQKEIEDVIAHMGDKDAAAYLTVFCDSPLNAVSSCLRGLICAPVGSEYIAADFSNIEGRGLAWLAGDERKLQRFDDFDRGTGPDIYKATAADILGKSVAAIDDAERQAYGKVPELACGYGGGVGAFLTMAKTYGVDVSNERAETIKTAWRAEHPEIVAYWYTLETAALEAVLNPGRLTQARGTSFKVSGSFLWCKLPSGRVLCYPYPRVMSVETPWGEPKDAVTYMTVVDQAAARKSKIIPDPDAKGSWQRVSTYGGKLSENVTQAICRDLLVHSIREVEKAEYPVVLHVHDEVVAEVLEGFGSLKEFEALCSTAPAWAKGLPVVAKGWRGRRYRK